jgi:hypothetical protein
MWRNVVSSLLAGKQQRTCPGVEALSYVRLLSSSALVEHTASRPIHGIADEHRSMEHEGVAEAERGIVGIGVGFVIELEIVWSDYSVAAAAELESSMKFE